MNIVEGKFGAPKDEMRPIMEALNEFMANHLTDESTGKFLIVMDVDGKEASDDEVLLFSNYSLTELNYALDVLKMNLMMGG